MYPRPFQISKHATDKVKLDTKTTCLAVVVVVRGGRLNCKCWKMQVWKSEVQSGNMCTGGKYKYGIFKYGCARMENASAEN